MKKYNYFPLIKTRDSELRCFDKLGSEQLNKILPIYELTKSRKTKKSPDGDVNKRMEKIKKIEGKRPFILDVTTDDRYSNYQTRQLVDSYQGFEEWYNFIFSTHKDANIIPTIHITDLDDMSETLKFVHKASQIVKEKRLALRTPVSLDIKQLTTILTSVAGALKEDCKLILVIDAGQLFSNWTEIHQQACRLLNASLFAKEFVSDTVIVSSSFPKNVARAGKSDEHGYFNVHEEELYSKIRNEFKDISYGDYVSINLEQIELITAPFVPRIDIVAKDGLSFSYWRRRKNAGGYTDCANELLNSTDYINLHTWADDEIKNAAEGQPTGISPSFWISVRMNYYIQVKLNLHCEQ